MHTYKIHEAKAKLSSIINEALSGEEVIITKRNKPLVKIIPFRKHADTRRLGTAKGEITIHSDFDDIPEGFEDYLT
jgi:prevent-host-death family protein